MTDVPTIAMVDVYVPTMRLAAGFIKAGYDCVRVQSTPEQPLYYRSPSFSLDPFADNIIHRGDLGETARAVAKYNPVAVIPGGELGVELADEISETLGLATNGTALSEARRNKYVQTETVRAAGLRTARQLLVTSEEQLTDWHAEVGGRVVIKPIRSMGNDGVSFCATPAESVAAYRDIVDKTNILSRRNEGVVAQEYLIGTEYFLNTVSRDGHHRAIDMWRYTKLATNGIDRIEGASSVPPGSQEREELIRYGFAVLDALQIKHGPAHIELMLTPDGPYLVEVGARLSGEDVAYYADLALGESQIEWTVAAYTDPDRFLATYTSPTRLERHVAMAWLTSPVTGTLRSYPLLDQVKSLESFHNLHMSVKPGEQLKLSVDDTSSPMTIGLAHPVEAIVDRDFSTVCYLDGQGFYDLEPEVRAA